MRIQFELNGESIELDVSPDTTLLTVLREELGLFGVKHGCETGECGACAILLDGVPVNTCVMLAAQVSGHEVTTIEALGEHPEQGWRHTDGLDPIQQAFVETGAIQCGFCTPAMILAARALINIIPDPSEEQVREALSGELCRCTGYIKPVQAVLRAAAVLRGEAIEPIAGPIPVPPELIEFPSEDPDGGETFLGGPEVLTRTGVMPRIHVAPRIKPHTVVGHPETKVDAIKLAQGKPAFTADIEMRGMLIAKVLHSPVAHARIKRIDATKARELPGVAAVLTWEDIPRVVYSTAGQSDPIPGPLDSFSLDNKVRFVGDRVAFVAAETESIAKHALELIEVEYEPLPMILDYDQALAEGAPRIHDEPEYVGFAESDPKRNLAAEIRIDIGDVEVGFAEADFVIEGTYHVPKVQQAHIEPHVVVTYWDEDDRLVIRTSTQVPFHVRRQLAPVLGLPPKRIRVIKPRIGGGFGGKQEILIEDVAAHLTIATGRPVRFAHPGPRFSRGRGRRRPSRRPAGYSQSRS